MIVLILCHKERRNQPAECWSCFSSESGTYTPHTFMLAGCTQIKIKGEAFHVGENAWCLCIRAWVTSHVLWAHSQVVQLHCTWRPHLLTGGVSAIPGITQYSTWHVTCGTCSVSTSFHHYSTKKYTCDFYFNNNCNIFRCRMWYTFNVNWEADRMISAAGKAWRKLCLRTWHETVT